MTPGVQGMVDEMKEIAEMANEINAESAKSPIVETPPTPEVIQETPKTEEQTPVEKTDAPVIADNTSKPEVETPKVEVTPEVVKTPEIDYAKILGETSNGRIKSKEDIQKILDENDQAKQMMESDSYQYASKLAAWEKAGHATEMFPVIQQLTDDEIKSLSPIDVIAVKMKLENPDWSEEDITLLINEEFKQDPESNTENVVRAGRLKMEREANSFRGKINELKQLTSLPNPENKLAEARQIESTRQETWKQNLPKFVTEFSKISIPLKGGKDTFDFIPTKEQKEALQTKLERIVTGVNINFDEQGINALKATMRKEFINDNINEISEAIASRATSKKTEEVIKEIHNPTGAKNDAPAQNTPKKSEEDVAWEAIEKAEIYGNGIRR